MLKNQNLTHPKAAKLAILMGARRGEARVSAPTSWKIKNKLVHYMGALLLLFLLMWVLFAGACPGGGAQGPPPLEIEKQKKKKKKKKGRACFVTFPLMEVFFLYVGGLFGLVPPPPPLTKISVGVHVN